MNEVEEKFQTVAIKPPILLSPDKNNHAEVTNLMSFAQRKQLAMDRKTPLNYDGTAKGGNAGIASGMGSIVEQNSQT